MKSQTNIFWGILFHGFISVLLTFPLTFADLYITNYAKLVPVPPHIIGFLCVFLAMILALLPIQKYSLNLRQQLVIFYYNRSIVIPLVCLSFISLVFSLMPSTNFEDYGKYILYPWFALSLVIMGMLIPVKPLLHKNFHFYFFTAWLILLLSGLVDMWIPGTFSNQLSRVAGLAVNANAFAFALVILTVCLLKFEHFSFINILILGASGLGVFLSLSRGGIIVFLIVVVFYSYTTLKSVSFGKRIIFVGIFILTVLLSLWVIEEMVQSSLLFQTSTAQLRMARLSGSTGFYDEDDARIILIQNAIRLIEYSPLWGYGTGFSYTLYQNTHNIYLLEWIDNGLLGIAVYIWLMIACLRMFIRRHFPQGVLFMIIIIIFGFFSHNMLEYRMFTLSLGVLSTISLINKKPETPARIQKRPKLVTI